MTHKHFKVSYQKVSPRENADMIIKVWDTSQDDDWDEDDDDIEATLVYLSGNFLSDQEEIRNEIIRRCPNVGLIHQIEEYEPDGTEGEILDLTKI